MKKYFLFVFLISSLRAEAAFNCRARVRALLNYFSSPEPKSIKHAHAEVAHQFEAASINSTEEFPPSVVANNRTYRPYISKSSTPEELAQIRNLEFASRFTNAAASAANLNIESPSYLIQKQNGSNENRIYASQLEDGKTIYAPSKERDKSKRELAMAKYWGYLCGVNNPWPGTYELRAIGDKKLVQVKPREALKFENETDEQILSNFSPEELNLIFTETKEDRIPWDTLENSTQDLGFSPAILQTLRERSDRSRKLIHQSAEASYENANEVIQRGQEMRKVAAENFHPEEIQKTKDTIRRRLDADIQKNTDFKNFDDYKAFIMRDPVYSKLVAELQANLQIQLNAPPTKRLSILQQGFKSLFETGISQMAKNSNELQHRNNVISRALGEEPNGATQLAPQYHPKSAYVFNKREKPDSNNQYGSDHYYLNKDKISEAELRNRLLCTMTLGDSGRMSGLWYGNPVSVEDFPYLAAPFIQQYREVSGQNDIGILQYRKGIFGLEDTLPHFRNGLEGKMKIPVRTNGSSLLDHTRNAHRYTSDHIESQLWGDASPDLIQEIAVDRNLMPSQLLQNSYRLNSTRLRTY